MPPFRSKCDYPPAATPTALDQPRAQLAEAIAEAAKARQTLNDTRDAEQKARESSFEARSHTDRLRAEVDKARSAADQIVAAICSGEADVLALSRPADEIHEAIALADQKAAAWKRAADQAEQAIPVRQRALAEAERNVDREASAVLAASLDIGAMLKDAELAAAWIVARRSVFLHLASVLPPGDDTAAINAFLARPWLMPEIDGGWRKHEAIKPFADALARLKVDAEARIDIAP